SGGNAIPTFVAAEAGVQASARSGAPFLCLDPGLRPLLSGENWIPTFVAPAEAGVQASARSGAPLLCLDPGLRRDDNVLKSRHIQSARSFARFFASIVASVIFPRTDSSGSTPGRR